MLILLVVGSGLTPWFRQLGGLGLLLIGVAGAVLPMPGGLEALVAVFAARHVDLWPYYAVMATVGSVIGGLFTYAIGRGGSQETLHHLLSPETRARLARRFQRWGAGAIVVSALLPPPFPVIPSLLVVGAMRYPIRRFTLAYFFARALRYGVVAGLAAAYGPHLFRWSPSYDTLVIVGILLVAVAVGVLFFELVARRRHSDSLSHS